MFGPIFPLPDGTYYTWRGSTYKGDLQSTTTAVVLSDEPGEGFEPNPLGGGFLREVPLSDVEIWTLRTRAVWRGRRWPVLARTASETVLGASMLSEQEAAELGAVMVDRGVFNLTVPTSEVTDLEQVRSAA